MNGIQAGKRWVAYIPADAVPTKQGYRVSLVVEGEAGHCPTDWYWGHAMDVAKEVAREYNRRRGIDAKEETKIILSSMFAGKVG